MKPWNVKYKELLTMKCLLNEVDLFQWNREMGNIFELCPFQWNHEMQS